MSAKPCEVCGDIHALHDLFNFEDEGLICHWCAMHIEETMLDQEEEHADTI